ncbi:MAG TPA: MnhB domain-containing protein [Chthoniobacterales bacterium]|nr:MnhB domain-containing protein [Chthoniobacterales bacterium]
MNGRGRLIMVAIGCLGLLVLLVRGFSGLPGFGNYPGPYGDMIDHLAPYDRHIPNAVTAVNFDYRALDTLGEEFILFASVSGLVLLLRGKRGEAVSSPPMTPEDRALLPRSAAVHWASFGFAGALLLFGIYVVLHGHLTPGGGFQGGAIAGTATLLVYLGTDYSVYRRSIPKSPNEFLESIGVGIYLLVGIGSMIAGGAFLQNLLPLGERGQFFSAGTIPLINFAVGLEVAGGFALLFAEFLEETREEIPEDEK